MSSTFKSTPVITVNESVGVGGNVNQVLNNKSVVIGYSNLPRGAQHGPYAINIGHNTNRILGTSSIAIGAHCGTGLSQVPDNCIVISAAGTGTQIIPSNSGACYMTPIRFTTPSTPMYYNLSTSEVTYLGTEILTTSNVIDSTDTYKTTQLGTAGTFTLGNGVNNQQFKTIYASSITPSIGFASLENGTNGNIYAMAIDSARNMLYLGGSFTAANGVSNTRIARYNLTTNKWSTPLGSGLNGYVYSLVIDNVRNILYVGGGFYAADGVANSCIAQYDLINNAWGSPLGAGTDTIVQALAIDTDQNVLYLGGTFAKAGGVANANIARYNITTKTWLSPMGAGMNGSVNALIVDSKRKMLYIGGWATTANGVVNNYISRYDLANDNWGTPLGAGTDGAVLALTIDDQRDTLYVGGTFSTVDGLANNNIARYNLTTNLWGTPLGPGLNGGVRGMSIDNTRNVISMVGYFGAAFSQYEITNGQWLNQNWMGSGLNNASYTVVFDNINNNIYVGGQFISADAITANYVVCVKLPQTRINGSFLYKFGVYSFLDMDTNAVVECMYMPNVATWVVTYFSGLNMLT